MRIALAVCVPLAFSVAFAEGPKTEVPSGPVLLIGGVKDAFRLRLEVSGSKSPTDDWNAFLDRLFDHFDRDGNGSLDRAEVGRMMPLPLPGGKELVIDFGKLDSDRNGKGSREELAAFSRAGGFTPVVLAVSLPAGDDARLADLFAKRLDANGDGKLTAAELRLAPLRLRTFDLNEDEALERSELLSSESIAKLPTARLKTVTASEKDTVLRIDLGPKPAARLTKGEARLVPLGGAAYRVRGPDARWWLTFRTGRAASDIRSASDFLVSQFTSALGEAKSLSKAAIEEDATIAGLLDLFAYADRDGDGNLTLAELNSYLRLVELGVRAQVWVTATDRGRNPFYFLDGDGDGRLSYREQLATPDLLGGEPEAKGLPGQFSLAFGGPVVRVWGGVAIPTQKQLTSDKPASKNGAAWFRAMDRNNDGVVSRREFLGSPEAFRQLDANGDGVISAAEASGARTR